MEDVKKDVIPMSSNKKKSFLFYRFYFHGDIQVKNTNYYYQLLRTILHL